MAINKVIYGGNTLIDLTTDTITAQTLLSGYTAHAADGTVINGSCEYDSNTQGATAAKAEILSGKTAYVKGNLLTGTMPNNGSITGSISTVAGTYTVPQGYHDGSGYVQIDATEQAKIIAANIKAGVEILGVTGTLSAAEDVTAQTKTATPKTTAQTILPDSGYDYLSQVTVAAIPYSESANSAGGTTVTIAG